MRESLSIFWFRRDLRLQDNAGLYQALTGGHNVLPVFIFDRNILDELEDKNDRRVDFIHQALHGIQRELAALGSSLQVFHGEPLQVFKTLLQRYKIKTVYCNHDYEPYARERDEAVAALFSSHSIAFKSYKDQCIFEKEEVLKEDKTPYTVFTPYSRKWKSQLLSAHYKTYPTEQHFGNFAKSPLGDIPSLEAMGFQKTDLLLTAPQWPAQQLLQEYKSKRDFPALPGTSRLSMHLRFGTISIRGLVTRALPQSESWLNELIWRDFYMMILWHFPHVVKRAFKPAYDRLLWKNDPEGFARWCKGQTGFPLVDAGMRELNHTGFMHNRVRMVTSSFLVKDLLIDWRLGEAYFAKKLNDFDLSANNGGWQWAAGTGCDAAPYFRVFNPAEQQKKFDPTEAYINKWIPEYNSPAYPPPMIDHAMARKRAIAHYRQALQGEHAPGLFDQGI